MIRFRDLGKLIKEYKDKYYYLVYSFNDKFYYLVNEKGEKLYSQEEDRFILILSKIQKYIKLYTSIDNSDKEENRILSTGLLLGYPKCCIKSEFNKSCIKGYFENINLVWDSPVYNEGIVCKLLNPFIGLYAHMCCYNICINTIKQCEKVLIYLQSQYGDNIVKYFFSQVNKKIEGKK